MTSHVEQQIAARIAKVRAEGERRRQERAELAAARTAGVARRNAAKLRRLGESADIPSSKESLMPAALRTVHCPACRRERVARLVATVVVTGAPHDVLHCTADDCALQWLVRAERPRTSPAPRAA